MTDETTVLDEEVVEAEAEEEVDESDDLGADASEDDTDEEAEDEEPEVVEFDFGGNKLAVPKGSIPDELAAEIDKFTKGTWSDYTRKSQDVTERSKALEARESAVHQIETLQADVLDAYSRGAALKAEIARISQALPDLWRTDPDQARQYSDYVRQKEGEFQSITSELSQKEYQAEQAQQQEAARRMEAGKAEVLRQVKDFSEADVVKFAIASGIHERDAHKWSLNPTVAIWAHKAMKYDAAQATAKAKPKSAPAKPVAPMKTSSGKKNYDLVKDADKLSADQWAERRNRELARKAER